MDRPERKRIMKTCTAIAVAAVLWIYAAQSGPERTDGPIEAAAAADTTVAESKPRQSLSGHTAEDTWAQRQREQRVLAMTQVDRNAILWGNESKPNGSIVLKLDPPLEKTKGSNVIEVELFSAFVDDDGLTQSDCLARELVLGVWWPSIEKAEVPISLEYRQVTQGPGLDSSYHESRRRIAELVVGGAWYAGNGDDRGLAVVKGTMRFQGEDTAPRPVTDADIEEILSEAGIDSEDWQEKTAKEVERTLAGDNARWQHFATQYLEWLGNEAKSRTPLGRGASPIFVVDGRYLVTMNTIVRQGGLKATERLFQTVNRLIRQRLEKNRSQKIGAGKTGNQEKKMNYTAATLVTATVFVGACAPTGGQEGRSPFGHEPWQTASGPAEVLPDAAHVKMKRSGKVVRMVFLEPLEGERATRAQEFIEDLIRDEVVTCKWPIGEKARGNPAAVSEEGYPIATCMIGCIALEKCSLSHKALEAGYGKLALGPWQDRTRASERMLPQFKRMENKNQRARVGIWK